MNINSITFADVFQSNFLVRALETFSVLDVLLTMAVSALIGFMIYLVYKKCYSGVMFSQSFHLSLIMMTVITALLIMAVTTSVVLSLGMLGALSIVRFRTSVKDPIDIVYIFWAIGAGIITGAGMFLLALAGSLFAAIIVIIMANVKSRLDPYLLIVNFAPVELEQRIYALLEDSVQRYNVKQKNILPGGVCELTLEVIIKKNGAGFLNTIASFEGVNNTACVSYNGDYSV